MVMISSPPQKKERHIHIANTEIQFQDAFQPKKTRTQLETKGTLAKLL